ncbi:hypothetical protein Scep_012162 [Stephania cephalantha]|uniref:Uncharacterized protein n=1 Tax=Stephania cephalantha TaxID=152367 RepID=A0AAP0JEP2_9MAGN
MTIAPSPNSGGGTITATRAEGRVSYGHIGGEFAPDRPVVSQQQNMAPLPQEENKKTQWRLDVGDRTEVRKVALETTANVPVAIEVEEDGKMSVGERSETPNGHGFLVASGVGRLFKEGRVGAIRGERHRGGRKKEVNVLRFLTSGGAYARRRRRRGGATGSPEQGAADLSNSSGSGTWRHLRGSGAWRKNSGPAGRGGGISGGGSGGRRSGGSDHIHKESGNRSTTTTTTTASDDETERPKYNMTSQEERPWDVADSGDGGGGKRGESFWDDASKVMAEVEISTNREGLEALIREHDELEEIRGYLPILNNGWPGMVMVHAFIAEVQAHLFGWCNQFHLKMAQLDNESAKGPSWVETQGAISEVDQGEVEEELQARGEEPLIDVDEGNEGADSLAEEYLSQSDDLRSQPRIGWATLWV